MSEWTNDPSPAAWIGPKLHRFAEDTGSVVPEGFEAYARLFHPVERYEGGTHWRGRWSELAALNGRVVHPEMQFHLVSRPVGEPPSQRKEAGGEPRFGSLPIEERHVLIEHLRRQTGTPERCWFCIWEGWGGLCAPRGITERVRLPGRDYLLHGGSLEVALEDPLEEQSPNLWWPDDRSWIVATEIDYAWTYIGGARRLIDRLLDDDRLEILPATLSDKPFHDSDEVNAALDRA